MKPGLFDERLKANMVDDFVRILDRNRIFKFGSLESIVIASVATFDGQDRFMAADSHTDAAFRIGRQIALPIVFAVAHLLTPGFRLDQIFVFIFLCHASPRTSKTSLTP